MTKISLEPKKWLKYPQTSKISEIPPQISTMPYIREFFWACHLSTTGGVALLDQSLFLWVKLETQQWVLMYFKCEWARNKAQSPSNGVWLKKELQLLFSNKVIIIII